MLIILFSFINNSNWSFFFSINCCTVQYVPHAGKTLHLLFTKSKKIALFRCKKNSPLVFLRAHTITYLRPKNQPLQGSRVDTLDQRQLCKKTNIYAPAQPNFCLFRFNRAKFILLYYSFKQTYIFHLRLKNMGANNFFSSVSESFPQGFKRRIGVKIVFRQIFEVFFYKGFKELTTHTLSAGGFFLPTVKNPLESIHFPHLFSRKQGELKYFYLESIFRQSFHLL